MEGYEQLVEYINSKVPFLGESINFLNVSITTTEILLPIIFLIVTNFLGNLIRIVLINRILARYIHDRKTILSIGNTTKYVVLVVGLAVTLAAIGLDKNLNYTFNKGSEHPISLFSLVRAIFFLSILIFLSGKFKSIFVGQFMKRYTEDIGVSQSIGTIIQYVVILVGGIIIVQGTIGNLGSLSVLAGALGVGIGFGLQNIANNFISGLIILFERPIKVGDRIEVGNINGDIVRISSRATTVNTNDNIAIIIPNSDFISKQVINWSHNDRNIRFHIPVGVSYNEDPATIKKILLDVANRHPDVLQNPKPDVLFIEYGDNSLNFDLMVWTSTYINKPVVLKSQLYYLIFEKFKEHNVEIPFPQRDIHIRSGLEGTQKSQ